MDSYLQHMVLARKPCLAINQVCRIQRNPLCIHVCFYQRLTAYNILDTCERMAFVELLCTIFSAFFLAVLCNEAADVAHVTIWNRKGADLSPTMFGAFFEEINFAGDGGLYAELLPNRDFETLGRGIIPQRPYRNVIRGKPPRNYTNAVPFVPPKGLPPPDWSDFRPWELDFRSRASATLDNKTQPFPSIPTSLHLKVYSKPLPFAKLTNPGPRLKLPCHAFFGENHYTQYKPRSMQFHLVASEHVSFIESKRILEYWKSLLRPFG